ARAGAAVLSAIPYRAQPVARHRKRLVHARRIAAALREISASTALAAEQFQGALQELVHRRTTRTAGAREAEVRTSVLDGCDQRRCPSFHHRGRDGAHQRCTLDL